MRTLLQNAHVFNTWLKTFLPGWILMEDGRIRYAFVDGPCPLPADEVIDAKGCYCIPSFIDIHLHIESSMVTPATFSRELLRHGVTTCVAEPHEIANVMGLEGVKAFMEQGRTCQADIFWGIPSSVPCSSYETTGGRIELADALELTRENDVTCLGEVMNCYSVLHEPNGKIRTWLECLRREHPSLTREGHISYYKGAELCDIAFHGVDSDHTSIGLDYFIERLKMGVFGEIQEKSILPEVVDYVEKNQVWDHFCIVTDDVMPDQLYHRGHLDYLVRKAIGLGMRPERAIIAATWNPAQRMKFYDRGMIAPGRRADLVLVDDLQHMRIQKTIKDGHVVYDAGAPRETIPALRRFPAPFYHSVQLRELTEDDFRIHTSLPDGMHLARMMEPDAGTGFVRETFHQVDVHHGQMDYDATPYCLIAVFDRYTGQGKRMLGLVCGNDFIKYGAVACTYAHDHHNLLVAGKTAHECAMAANWVIAHQGGYCVVEHNEITASLELEVGGIVSEAPLEEMAQHAQDITQALLRMGYQFKENPIMSFSVLGLSVSPQLRITDKGYVKVKAGQLLPLFDEEASRQAKEE